MVGINVGIDGMAVTDHIMNNLKPQAEKGGLRVHQE